MRSEETAADGGVRIAPEKPTQVDVIAMIAALDDLQRALYPAESNHLTPLDVLSSDQTVFLTARDPRGRLLGCGSALLHDGYGEIKRMFVSDDARGVGLGARIVGALEAALRERGIACARLETGIYQPHAIRLYEKCGYTSRDPFGSYAPDPLSVFMEKRLG
ncbi:MAG: GNAT family N-acetyltransferase [Pseudomonadota bacterium]